MAGTAAGAAKARATRAGAATPTDRRAPARKATVRKPTPAELAEMPDAQVETLAEDAVDDGSVQVEFMGEVFDVTSPGDWRASAQEALAQGLFVTWSRGAMTAESSARFAEVDPTNRQCIEFMNAYDAATRAQYGSDPKAMGRQLGLSRSTRRSSR